jgi:hypothetical protein
MGLETRGHIFTGSEDHTDVVQRFYEDVRIQTIKQYKKPNINCAPALEHILDFANSLGYVFKTGSHLKQMAYCQVWHF